MHHFALMAALLQAITLPFTDATNLNPAFAYDDCNTPDCCAPEVVAAAEYYGLYNWADPKTGNGPNSVSRRTYYETYYADKSEIQDPNCTNRIDTIVIFRNVECTGETHWNPSIDFGYQPKLSPDKDLVFFDNEVTVQVQLITNQIIPIDISYNSAQDLEYSGIGTFRLPGAQSKDFGKAQLIHIGQVPCDADIGFRFSVNAFAAGQKNYNYYPSCPTSGVGLRYGCCQYSADCLN